MQYKLFETEHGQIMAKVNFNTEEDCFELLFEFECLNGIDDLEGKISLSFTGDDAKEKAFDALRATDKKAALLLLKTLKSAFSIDSQH